MSNSGTLLGPKVLRDKPRPGFQQCVRWLHCHGRHNSSHTSTWGRSIIVIVVPPPSSPATISSPAFVRTVNRAPKVLGRPWGHLVVREQHVSDSCSLSALDGTQEQQEMLALLLKGSTEVFESDSFCRERSHLDRRTFAVAFSGAHQQYARSRRDLLGSSARSSRCSDNPAIVDGASSRRRRSTCLAEGQPPSVQIGPADRESPREHFS